MQLLCKSLRFSKSFEKILSDRTGHSEIAYDRCDDQREGDSAQHDSLEGVIVNEIVELCCDGSDSHGGISFLCSGFVPLCCDYSISARPLQLLCKYPAF